MEDTIPAYLAGRLRRVEGEAVSSRESVRGVPLKAMWNDEWEFVVVEDDAEHPAGVGDFAEMNRLMTATNEKSLSRLKSLLGDAAEVLNGTYDGRPVWFFNVTRRVDRKDIGKLTDGAVFRIDPIGLDILCGPAFKDAIDRSGLKGLSFVKVDPDDRYGMI